MTVTISNKSPDGGHLSACGSHRDFDYIFSKPILVFFLPRSEHPPHCLRSAPFNAGQAEVAMISPRACQCMLLSIRRGRSHHSAEGLRALAPTQPCATRSSQFVSPLFFLVFPSISDRCVLRHDLGVTWSGCGFPCKPSSSGNGGQLP